MATSVIRRFWIDLDSMRITDSLGDATPLDTLELIARDNSRVGFQFHRNGVPELLASGSVLTFGIKALNNFGGDYLASVTSFTDATTIQTSSFTDSDFYYGTLNLNTTEITSLLGSSESSISAMAELELQVSGVGRASTKKIPTTIYNDINQGGEGTPTSGTPAYPSASEIQRWKPNITSLTGGTSADLDSLTTTDIDVSTTPYAIAINCQDIADQWEVWILDAGTDAEDAPNGIVRPDDYNASTNAKVWKRKAFYGSLVDGATLTTGLTFPENGFKLTDTDGDILTLKSGDISANKTLTVISDGNYTLTLSGNATLSGNNTGDVTVSGTANEITVANNTISIPSTFDLSGKSVFKVPVSASPTISANGTLALDTTVTNFSHGLLKYYGNETLVVVAVPESQISSLTNGHVIKYNSTNDEFEIGAAATSFYDQILISPEQMYLETSSPAGALATVATSSNSVDYRYFPFDASSNENVCGTFQIPDDWDGSSIKYKAIWTAASGSGAVVWICQALGLSNDDPMDTLNSGVPVTDTLITAYDVHFSPAGTLLFDTLAAAAGDFVHFRLSRNGSNGSDTLGVDALLLGVAFQFRRLGTSSAW